MTPIDPSPAERPRRVRETVWRWDAAPNESRPPALWLRVLVQLCVMGVIAAVLFYFQKRIIGTAVLSLAAFFVVLACVAPAGYRRVEQALRRFGHGTGIALTYLLLAPFFYLCFLPGRCWLRLRGKDPMRRAFPAPEESCWRSRTPPRAAEPYRRQY